MQLSELFYSLQGEGTTRGTPSVFLRFNGCNLTCGVQSNVCDATKASWICDSYKIWQQKNIELTNEQLLEKLLNWGSREDYNSERIHLVWTGGEPLIEKNANQIYSFLTFARDKGFFFFSEVETNGTQFSKQLFDEGLINLVNCSPKLSNSGIHKDVRCNEVILEQLSCIKNTYFKFVITSKDQWYEIENDFSMVSPSRIILMPGMDCLNETNTKVMQSIWELAQEKKVLFSTREHIHVWNKLTGV